MNRTIGQPGMAREAWLMRDAGLDQAAAVPAALSPAG